MYQEPSEKFQSDLLSISWGRNFLLDHQNVDAGKKEGNGLDEAVRSNESELGSYGFNSGVAMCRMMNDYTVETTNDSVNDFIVKFHGPKESLYEGGLWKVRVQLPESYPYSSPSIVFTNTIYHPNINEQSGSICMNVLNQMWNPVYDLVHVFEVFLPQLLLDPNPFDPLNSEAASLMMSDREQYDAKVKDYCQRYAKNEEAGIEGEDANATEDDKSQPSEDENAGHVDP